MHRGFEGNGEFDNWPYDPLRLSDGDPLDFGFASLPLFLFLKYSN